MKDNKTKNMSYKLESAIDAMKKRLYEIQKENNPKLTYNQFLKNIDSYDDVLKKRLFLEELDKALSDEPQELKLMLKQVATMIDFSNITFKEHKVLMFFKKCLTYVLHFVLFYIVSVALFGLLIEFVKVDYYLIFYLSLITALIGVVIDKLNSTFFVIRHPIIFWYSLIIPMITLLYVNSFIYQVFTNSWIWILYLILLILFNYIVERKIGKYFKIF